MFTFERVSQCLAGVAMLMASNSHAGPNLGQPATAEDVAAWDLSIPPGGLCGQRLYPRTQWHHWRRRDDERQGPAPGGNAKPQRLCFLLAAALTRFPGKPRSPLGESS